MLDKTILALPTVLICAIGIFYTFFFTESQDFVILGCFAVLLVRGVAGLFAKEEFIPSEEISLSDYDDEEFEKKSKEISKD